MRTIKSTIFPINTAPKCSSSLRSALTLNFFTLVIAIFSQSVLAASSTESIPDFKPLQGDWTFNTSWTSPLTVLGETMDGIITIDFITNFPLKDEKNCQAITLNIVGEKLLASVVKCADEQYFLCGGRIDGCGLPVDLGYGEIYTNVTKRKGNTLTLHPEYKETRYVLEFSVDKIIYRYQEKDCFISYPHGCLIDAFTWHDIGSYEMNKIGDTLSTGVDSSQKVYQ